MWIGFSPSYGLWSYPMSIKSVQWRMQDFVNGEAVRPFSNKPTEMEINFQICWVAYSPSKNCRAAAGKTTTRRLIRRIILESVVNASSRRRWGLSRHRCPADQCKDLLSESPTGFFYWFFNYSIFQLLVMQTIFYCQASSVTTPALRRSRAGWDGVHCCYDWHVS